jgi:hypothetical protein
MDEASKFVETDGTIPVITISNVFLHCERIVPEMELRSKLDASFNSNGLQIAFYTFNDYSNTVAAGSNGKQTLIINQRYASLLDIILIWIPQSTINSTVVNDKFINWPRLTDQHQLILNNVRIPEENVVYSDAMAIEAYKNYQIWLNKWRLDGILTGTPPPIGNSEFAESGNRFFLIEDLREYPYDEDVINPVSNALDSINLQWDVYLTAPLPQVYRAQNLIRYLRKITVNPNHTVVVNF